jgi:alpha-galactosidase
MKIVEMRKDIRSYAGPDHWNDPDMMEVGRGMSLSEDRAHFSLWCMMAAPLMAGNDLRSMKKEIREILVNKEVIAIDQDSLGVQGFRFNSCAQGVEVWAKPLVQGDWAICFLNRTEQVHKLEFDWAANVVGDDISKKTLNAKEATYSIRDLWAKKSLGTTSKILSAEIPVHDVLLIRLVRQ